MLNSLSDGCIYKPRKLTENFDFIALKFMDLIKDNSRLVRACHDKSVFRC